MKTKRPAKVKKSVRKLTKASVWKLFSRYIRLRDCLETTGTLTYGRCITCNERYPIEKLQAGHLLDGRSGGVLFDDRGVFAQCYRCNVLLHGNKERFVPWFLDTYGRILFDELQVLKRKPKKWKQADLEELKDRLEKDIKYIQEL